MLELKVMTRDVELQHQACDGKDHPEAEARRAGSPGTCEGAVTQLSARRKVPPEAISGEKSGIQICE